MCARARPSDCSRFIYLLNETRISHYSLENSTESSLQPGAASVSTLNGSPKICEAISTRGPIMESLLWSNMCAAYVRTHTRVCAAGGTLLGADVLAGVHKTRVKGHGGYDEQTCSGSKSTSGEMSVSILQAFHPSLVSRCSLGPSCPQLWLWGCFKQSHAATIGLGRVGQ